MQPEWVSAVQADYWAVDGKDYSKPKKRFDEFVHGFPKF